MAAQVAHVDCQRGLLYGCLLAVVRQEAHDNPLSPLFEVQKKQAAVGLHNNVTF